MKAPATRFQNGAPQRSHPHAARSRRRSALPPIPSRAAQCGSALLLLLSTAPTLCAQYVATPLQTFEIRDPPCLHLPTSVAVALDGRVFVADGVHDRVVEFDAHGQVLALLLDAADRPLRSPLAVHVDADGALWIADTGNERIVALTRERAALHIVEFARQSGPRIDPAGLLSTPRGLWIADNDNHRLLRWLPASAALQEFSKPGEALGELLYPFNLALTDRGDLLVADVINGRVQRFDEDGSPLGNLVTYGLELGSVYRPTGIAVDSDGRVWVSDSVTGVIQCFTRDGAFLDALRDADRNPLRLAGPVSLAFDVAGALYVVERDQHRVRKFRIERLADPPPTRPRPLRAPAGQAARACSVCHVDWLAASAGNAALLTFQPNVDAPAASLETICLSCHDGAVSDSRRRVWVEHGHQTGVRPSPRAAVPSTLPLSQGRLECRTCHAAHGPGVAQADIARAVGLRLPNRRSELCVACHADAAPGGPRATHPIGPWPASLPENLRESGARLGPTGFELTCQACHTPHGGAAEALLVVSNRDNALCQTCHALLAPAAFDAPPSHHPLSAALSAPQRAAVAQLGRVANGRGELVCSSCHQMHNAVPDNQLLARPAADDTLCTACHTQQSGVFGTSHDLSAAHAAEHNAVGRSVAQQGRCSACHQVHQAARVLTPTAADRSGACATCHVAGAVAHSKPLHPDNHQPADCALCHDPHQAANGAFLHAAPDALCTRCHAQQASLIGGGHDARRAVAPWGCEPSAPAGRCLACHRPHAETAIGRYRASAASTDSMHGAINPNSIGPDAACLGCHAEFTPADGPHRGHPGHCRDCHDPHAGLESARALLRAPHARDAAAACLGCHASHAGITRTPHDPARLALQFDRNARATVCGPCHSVHAPAAARGPNLLLEPSTEATASASDSVQDRYCTNCHTPQGPAALPARASHPRLAMFDPTGGATLPLFAHDTKDAQGQIACRTCHLPHGRPLEAAPALTPSSATAASSDDLASRAIGSATSTVGLRPLLRPFDAPNACSACHGEDALRRFLYFHRAPPGAASYDPPG